MSTAKREIERQLEENARQENDCQGDTRCADLLRQDRERIIEEVKKLKALRAANQRHREAVESKRDFANRLLDLEDLGNAVSAYVRDEARAHLGLARVETIQNDRPTFVEKFLSPFGKEPPP